MTRLSLRTRRRCPLQDTFTDGAPSSGLAISARAPASRRRLGVWLLLLACLLPRPAQAVRVGVVAPFGGLGVPAADVTRVQRWLESALGSVAGYRWLATARLQKILRGSARPLGCESEPRCLAGLARQIGAELAVSGEVGSLAGGFMIYLRLVDASGESLRTVNGVLEPAQAGLRDAARGLAVQLLDPGRYSGTLRVLVDVPNAWIYLDGKRVSRSPAAPLTGVSAGTHALRVTHESYRDFVRFVTVEFDKVAVVPVQLTAYAVRSEQMRLVQQGGAESRRAGPPLVWYRRWWALTAFGAVVLAGSATAAGLLFQRSAPRDAQIAVPP